MKKRYILLITGLGLLSSCATLFRGEEGNPEKRTFNLAGNVEGAVVYLNDDSIGLTPLRFTMNRLTKTDELLIKHKDYKDLYMWVERKPNIGWAIISFTPCIATIPLIGIGCIATYKDYNKGSFYDLKERDLTFEMEKK